MTRRGLLFSFALTALVFHAVGEAAAQGTIDFRREYRFLPRFSMLNESGGIAGYDVDFRIRGTFDFVTRPGDTDVWPPQTLAKFDDVEAWASHPILAYVLNVDETLNLSGLGGLQVFSGPHGLDVYRFRGAVGEDEVPVNLHVATLGRWLYMRGETDPPCCDFFEYKIRALAHELPMADFDEDAEVGSADLARWTQSFGAPALPPGGGLAPGDANGDGVVDGADFLAWQRQQGQSPPVLDALDAMIDAAIASAGTASFGAIPEPGAATLAAVGASLAAMGRRRRLAKN